MQAYKEKTKRIISKQSIKVIIDLHNLSANFSKLLPLETTQSWRIQLEKALPSF